MQQQVLFDVNPGPTCPATTPPAQAERPHVRLSRSNRKGQVSLQFMVIRAFARDGFLASATLRDWATRSWCWQAGGQRLRDCRRVFGLTIIGPLETEADIRRVAREQMPDASERQKLYKQAFSGNRGKVWIIRQDSRAMARELVQQASEADAK